MSKTATLLKPLKMGSLGTRVFETLRDAIFAGRLKAGDPLRELHLARELNVSQATVREALVQLEQLGLVVRTPNIGTHVTRLSPEEVGERIELRVILEERAMIQAAMRLGPPEFEELGQRIERITDAISRDAYFEEAQADLAFHRYIWEQTGNRTLYRTLDQIAVPLFAFVSILRGATRQSLKEVVQSHEGIVEALRHPSQKRIREALRQHFESGLTLPDSAT
jgi:DNA-binding GntR family transcriptional regulator